MIKIFFVLFTSFTFLFSAEIFNFGENLDLEFLMDKSEATLDLCYCSIEDGGKGAGVRMRIADPVGVQESSNSPWNLVSLDVQLSKASVKQGSSRKGGNNKRFNHFIAFAPFSFLNLVQDYVCFEKLPVLNALYFSEVIPTQNSDIIASLAQLSKGPFSKSWYNNMPAMLLSLPDCAATTFFSPMNSLFYNVGCAGVTGNNTSFGNGRASDPLMSHHVLAAIQLDDLHYTGLIAKTSNATFGISPVKNIPNTMCGPKYFPIIIKDEVYIQPMMPTVWSAQKLGMFRTFHADFKNKPGSGDDVATWLWVIKDFCAGGSKCGNLYPTF